MTKARYKQGLVLLILLASLIPWPQATAITPQDQTISITDTHDELFITETGIGIDSQLCHILDPNMDIRSFLVFRELEINYWEPLKNATLRFRTTAIQDFDADSSVTVYGMRYSDLQVEGWLNPSWVLTVPLTSAYVNVNTSQFYGQTWHEVNVTAIVEELIRSYDWDGDGADGTETGDAIGFIILGAEGYDTRWFIDYLYGSPSLATQLVIHWNHEPPPPSGAPPESTFVEQYGNYTIWLEPDTYDYPELDPVEYVYTNGTSSPYNFTYDTIDGDGPYEVMLGTDQPLTVWAHQRKIIRVGNGTLFAVYRFPNTAASQIYVKKSIDEGETWTDETLISTFPGMAGEKQDWPSIAVDSNDTIYVTWSGETDVYTEPNYQIWVVNYTTSWGTPIRISTYTGMNGKTQFEPMIAIDSDDKPHVTWPGKATGYTTHQIWYLNCTTTWGTPERISDDAGMVDYYQSGSSIAIDSQGLVHLTFRGESTEFRNSRIWYANITADTLTMVSTAPGMGAGAGGIQGHSAIAIDPNDYIYIASYGGSTAFPAPEDQIWVVNYTTSWGTPIRISTYEGMDDYLQRYLSIAIDSTNYTYVMWNGKATGLSDYDKVWLATYTDSWATPECLQPIGQATSPISRWARWPAVTVNGTYFVADANGTILEDDLDSQEDAEDWIDTYDPDPEDPDPAGEWSEGPGGETGAFTRFRMRLWFLAMGFGCVFGPVLFFAWRRPSGYYLFCGAIVMLIGLGLLLSIGQV